MGGFRGNSTGDGSAETEKCWTPGRSWKLDNLQAGSGRPRHRRREQRVGGDRSQDQRMAGEQKPSSNLLEQFILLAKGTSGSALTTLISQVLEAPGVYVFGELLELANVQELAEGANAAYLQLLNLFAYGTYPDYIVVGGTEQPTRRACQN